MHYHLHKKTDGIDGARAYRRIELLQPHHRIPNAEIVGGSDGGDFVHRGIADAAFGIIDNALESLVVVAVLCEFHIGNQILDFLALVERKSTKNFVWNLTLVKALFEASRLRMAAVEQRKIRIFFVAVGYTIVNVGGYLVGFVDVGGRFEYADSVAGFVFRKDLLFELSGVFGNDIVGGVDDDLGAAVILFQLENLRFFVVALKI